MTSAWARAWGNAWHNAWGIVIAVRPARLRAPPADLPGQKLDAELDVVYVLAANDPVRYDALLNKLEVQAVDHYMVTGWLNAATVLAMFQPPSWDKVGQALKVRVAFLQNLINNPPVMPVGNHYGYGDSGWTTILQNFQQQLYAAQIQLVEHIMDLPGGTSASTILNTFTGSQSFPFAYRFASVGFTEPGG